MVSVIFGAEMTNLFGNFIKWLYEGIGIYWVTIVVFTVVFKAVTSPLDFWQKHLMRKNKKAMKAMQPKLAKLREEVGDNQSLYMQRQQLIYKEHGYSMLGACLPMIVTLVIFGTIFSGFSAMVRYQNETLYEDMSAKYYEVYKPIEREKQNEFLEREIEGWLSEGKTDAERQAAINEIAGQAGGRNKVDALNTEIENAAKPLAENAVKVAYEESKDSFFWVENIFMADAPWAKVVPDYGLFSGGTGGFLGIGRINAKVDGLNEEEYDKVMGAVIDSYGSKPNGYLILPILCLLLNILMMKLNPQQQPGMGQDGAMRMTNPMFGNDPQMSAKQTQMSSKMTMFMMPAMMFIFALFYSGAFTIYLVVSSLFSIVFNFIYNKVYAKKDKQEEILVASTTYVRKSELEAIRKKKEQEEREKAEREEEAKAKKILEKTDSKFKDIDKL
jgi:YidC/Oxa1 family membrane protein insertase